MASTLDCGGIITYIKQAQKELDKVNLTVAEWRVQNGVNSELVHLYRLMGNLSNSLIGLEADTMAVNSCWQDVSRGEVA